MSKFLSLILFFTLLLFPGSCLAKTNSFISVVNPIRGNDFWDLKDQRIEDGVKAEAEVLTKNNILATWLLRYDALENKEIQDLLINRTQDEKGIFLEVTPTWAKDSKVNYHTSDSWHKAGSAFLTGYERDERERLIDASFKKFKEVFGYYPHSVGAWWVDAYSLDYMQKKYDISASLIVSDQYSTDNYQIWGQYFSTPYYPAKENALHPAQNLSNKLPVVIMQWAPRDPVNSYGNGVEQSTFSVQANDYIDYHNLNTDYFSSLIGIYTNQPFNKFAHLVVGLENSYSWKEYGEEYKNQIELLASKRNKSEISILSMNDFALWYKQAFPALSPENIIIAEDSLGSDKKTVWFMNLYYRAGWFFDQNGSIFRDIRQYVQGEEELCFKKACNQLNFATFATRVLDDVSFGQKWIIDEGKISDFRVKKSGENYQINYKNEAGGARVIEFLPRDIGIDGKISSIDGAILDATKHQIDRQSEKETLDVGFRWSLSSSLLKTIKFLLFIIIGCLVPGYILINKLLGKENSFYQRSFLSIAVGFALLLLITYSLSLIKLKQLLFLYLFVNLLVLIKNYSRIFEGFSYKVKSKSNILILGLILLGTVFQQLPTFKNGLIFPYGAGLWGPNTHDGIWHVSLINQLVKSVPPQNPIFANTIIKNYHYFYDLLIAVTNNVTNIPIVDLVFRFYPILFSLLLGIGTLYFIKGFFGNKKFSMFFPLYLVYFAGSFGWIVEYLKNKSFSGESAFWANQSISFNLNPPFAISLIFIIAILQLLGDFKLKKLSIIVLTILCGSLIAFKSYAGILILLTFLLTAILRKSLIHLIIFFTSSLISLILFLSNFSFSQKLIVFSPFWFIHSMIDASDRVGWIRLSLARNVGLSSGNWFKFVTAEVISLLIFIFGNLGMRFFSIFSLIKIKSILKNTNYSFLFIFSFSSLLIPILFIQAGNPWNTIQFIYYFLYVTAVLGGILFAEFISKLNKIFALIFIFAFIIITPINSWASANGYLANKPHAFISNQELDALKFLSSQEDGIVLTYPYDQKLKTRLSEPWPLFVYDSTAYVSAFSKKASFVDDEAQNQILLTDYKKRLVAEKDLFEGRKAGKEFLKENNIKYIYLPKIFNKRLNQENLGIKNIFGNEEILIYKVEN